ncbi:MAG TPA: MIP/aquaporin family protein [Candidatus Limnocylindrales bacterium]|nr:MIP/aquaporin family protein [Candidatus Limnocylindrales bacterium]
MLEKFLAEVLGTGALILLGDGVVAGVLLARSKAQNSGWIVITMGWGLAVFVGVLIAAPVSGAHLNPAVTLGLAMQEQLDPGTSGVTWDQVPVYWAGEMLGAFIGAILVFLHYFPHWSQTEDADLKLAVYSTGPAIRSTGWNVLSEIIGTFVLVFVILAFGTPGSPTGALGALSVALLVVVIGLSLGGTTGYAINPARDLGPRIAHFLLPIPGKRDSDWSYSWIPVVGPLIGGAVAVIVYQVFFPNFMFTVIPTPT